MNKFKQEVVILAILLIVSSLISVHFYSEFLEKGIDKVPIHWNINNEADNFASPLIASLFGPAIIILIMLATFGMSRKKYSQQKIKSTRFVITLIGGLMVFINWVALSSASAYGESAFNAKMIHLALGIMFVLLGNQLGKLPYSKWIGIRVPATLNNEEVWNRVHQKSGKFMVLSGVCIILLPLLEIQSGAIYFYIPLIISMIYMTFIYPTIVKKQLEKENKKD